MQFIQRDLLGAGEDVRSMPGEEDKWVSRSVEKYAKEMPGGHL